MMKKSILFLFAFSGFLIISFGIASLLYAQQSLQGVKFNGTLPTCNGSGANTISVATGTLKICYGSVWNDVTGGSATPITWIINGSSLYPTSTSLNVGIATTTPATALTVVGTTTLVGGIQFDRATFQINNVNTYSGGTTKIPAVRYKGYSYETSLMIGKNDAKMAGSNNIAIGESAGYVANDSGYAGSVALGYRAGYYSQGTSVHIGYLAGYAAGSYGADNTVVGAQAGYQASTFGTENAFFGFKAGYGNVNAANGGKNTFIGAQTGYTGIGTENTAIGHSAMHSMGGAQGYNTALGMGAGYTNNSSNNVFLGYKAGYYETGSGKLFIDNAPRANESDGRTKALLYGVFNADPANQILTINGSVGIATTTPGYKLTVVGTSYFSSPVIVQTPTADGHAATKAYVDSALGGSSLWTYSGISNTVSLTNMSREVSIGDGSGTDFVVGAGAGKIDVGTVDPVYTIGGNHYATYFSGMTGVKEETAGTLTLGKNAMSILDFKNAEVGGDLWLFAKTTNLKKNFNALSILLTPGFEGKVWYKKDTENMRVMIYGDESGEVSYRLTAPRFDAADWKNIRTGDEEGFNLDKLIKD